MFKIIHWTHFSLNRGNFERTFVWSEVISSALLSDQRWFRAHFSLIIGNFERTSVWLEADSSALRSHNDLRAHTRLIRDHFSLGRSDQRSHLSGTVWSRRLRARPQPGFNSWGERKMCNVGIALITNPIGNPELITSPLIAPYSNSWTRQWYRNVLGTQTPPIKILYRPT